jgi:hypothetical protein
MLHILRVDMARCLRILYALPIVRSVLYTPPLVGLVTIPIVPLAPNVRWPWPDPRTRFAVMGRVLEKASIQTKRRPCLRGFG